VRRVAREDLAQADGTVAEIAFYWGFANPGRFTRAYRDRFGEFPAHTRDRSRATDIIPGRPQPRPNP
jgi:transcriptional regulator GlxA family with amidase domain